jgi:F-type H+-transporting ATPase subunit delta
MRGASSRASRTVIERVEAVAGTPGGADGGEDRGSKSALQRVQEVLTGGGSDSPGSASASASGTQVGEELFALCGVLDAEPTLRRVLTDPTVEADRRAALAEQLLSNYGDDTVAVVSDAVRQRWSSPRDLADGLEQGGITAFLVAAQAEGELDELEDGLFRFARIIEGDPELRDALNDRTAPVEARQRLVDALLGDRVGAATVQLARQAAAGRHRSVIGSLAEMQKLAAARRQRLVAVVRVARPLSDELRERLAAALTARFGHELQLNVIVDPEVVGGVRVTVGDEIVDGTVATKLAEARRRLTG